MKRPEIETNVGQAGFDEHGFMGYRLFADLVGRDSFWSLLSLACNGPRLDTQASQVLDDVAGTLAVADPHIWPLKICRLVASYGGAMVAACACQLAFAGQRVGPRPAMQAARDLECLRDSLGGNVTDAQAVTAEARKRIAAGYRFAGFGVPFRPQDERVVALQACLERRRRDSGLHVRLVNSLAAALQQHNPKLRLNIAGLCAAVCLDLGLRSDHLFGIVLGLSLAPEIANAHEGAAQQPELLRRLPDRWIRYVGVPPRTSPRAGSAVD